MSKIENGLVWFQIDKKDPFNEITISADQNWCQCCDTFKWIIGCIHKKQYVDKVWSLCPECILDTSYKKLRCICCNPSACVDEYDICQNCSQKLIQNTEELYQICKKPKDCECRFCKHLSRI